MKILNSVLSEINAAISDIPPETGGILGSTDGDIIDRLVMDHPAEIPAKRCAYAPNTDFLNQCIGQWQESRIAFRGIFHTHFGSVRTLSCSDVKYINAIMAAMPDSIHFLYFPVFVLPDRVLVCYQAERHSSGIRIVQDALQLLSI